MMEEQEIKYLALKKMADLDPRVNTDVCWLIRLEIVNRSDFNCIPLIEEMEMDGLIETVAGSRTTARITDYGRDFISNLN